MIITKKYGKKINKMKIILVVGDGRSGSTILEEILNNIENSVSVGESFRFWERYYKKETLCGCTKKIDECDLWTNVHNEMALHYNNITVDKIKENIRKVSSFGFRNELNDWALTNDAKFFIGVISTFFSCIFSVSKSNIIIDSSKNPFWANFVAQYSGYDTYIIHLNRDLPSVANSWKKKVKMNDYYIYDKYMPNKSSTEVIRTALRNKLMCRYLKKNNKNYHSLNYHNMCINTDAEIFGLASFVEEKIPQLDDLVHRKNHGISGNPFRHELNRKKIEIRYNEPDLKLLGKSEKLILKIADRLIGIL